MSQLNYCPYCGATNLISVVTQQTPATEMFVCSTCHKAFPLPAQSPVTSNKIIEEKTIELCLKAGLLHGIKFYLSEKSKQSPDSTYSLKKAKEEVEDLLASRGLTGAVKKPGRNGCLLVIILLSMAVAAAFYLFYVKK